MEFNLPMTRSSRPASGPTPSPLRDEAPPWRGRRSSARRRNVKRADFDAADLMTAFTVDAVSNGMTTTDDGRVFLVLARFDGGPGPARRRAGRRAAQALPGRRVERVGGREGSGPHLHPGQLAPRGTGRGPVARRRRLPVIWGAQARRRAEGGPCEPDHQCRSQNLHPGRRHQRPQLCGRRSLQRPARLSHRRRRPRAHRA